MGACCSHEPDEFTGSIYKRNFSWRQRHLKSAMAQYREKKKLQMRSLAAREYFELDKGTDANEDDIEAIVGAMSRLEAKESDDPDAKEMERLSRLSIDRLEDLNATSLWNHRAMVNLLTNPPVPYTRYRIICTRRPLVEVLKQLNTEFQVSDKYAAKGGSIVPKRWRQIDLIEGGEIRTHIYELRTTVTRSKTTAAVIEMGQGDALRRAGRQAAILETLFSCLLHYTHGILVLPYDTVREAANAFRSGPKEVDYFAGGDAIYRQQEYCLTWSVLARYADMIVDDSTIERMHDKWGISPFSRAAEDFAAIPRMFAADPLIESTASVMAAHRELVHRACEKFGPRAEAIYTAYMEDYWQRRLPNAPLRNGMIAASAVRPSDEAMVAYQAAQTLRR